MLITTRFWLIRHAPVPDPEGRITGQADVACDTSDQDAFGALAQQLPAGAVIVQSPLQRCAQTGAALALGPAEVVDSRWQEQDFGIWTGRTWGALASATPPEPLLQAFWDDPAHTSPPQGESFAALCQRVRSGIVDLAQTYAGRDVVVLAHAGSIRAALAVALDMDPARALSFVIDPLSLTRLDWLPEYDGEQGGQKGGWRIEAVNRLYDPL